MGNGRDTLNFAHMTGSTISVNVIDTEIENGNKVPRRRSSASIRPLSTTHYEHRVSMPFSNNTYAAFKKGNVVRGILCPSLTNSFR